MKKFGVIASVFALMIFAATFVSAQEFLQPVADGAKSLYDKILEPFGKFLLGRTTDTGELFFGKLLLFVLLLSIIWLVVDKFPLMSGKRKTGFVVAAIVSILAVRFITPDWLDAVILPYSVMGIAMTSLLPFILYFFFVKDLPNRSMRKIAWILAAVIFFGLFLYRNAAVTSTVSGSINFDDAHFSFSKTTPGFNPTYIYLFTALASLLMLWLDGTIQRGLAKARYQDLADIKKVERRAELVEDYDKVQERFAKRIISKADANRIIAGLKNRATAFGVDPALFKVIP
ncbi:MAG: hypothetical protein AABY16_04070 [Nanoarchaeota archaeon]